MFGNTTKQGQVCYECNAESKIVPTFLYVSTILSSNLIWETKKLNYLVVVQTTKLAITGSTHQHHQLGWLNLPVSKITICCSNKKNFFMITDPWDQSPHERTSGNRGYYYCYLLARPYTTQTKVHHIPLRSSNRTTYNSVCVCITS